MMELGTVAASEQLIFDLYIDLRRRINGWAAVTKQTAQARMGYVGQHLVSVVTGHPGGRSGARGKDLVISPTEFGEIKTCYRVDQLGKCRTCNAGTASIELECSECGSNDIKRNDDSKWLISIRHDAEFAQMLDPKVYFLVLFDFVDLLKPDTVRASIWEVDPLAPGFALGLIDYYSNIRAASVSKAPFNLWPFSLKFDLMRPRLIYRSFIGYDDKITTERFPSRDMPEILGLPKLCDYSRATNLTVPKVVSFANYLGLSIGVALPKRAMLLKLDEQILGAGLDPALICDALSLALYKSEIQPHLNQLPHRLSQKLAASGLLAKLV